MASSLAAQGGAATEFVSDVVPFPRASTSSQLISRHDRLQYFCVKGSTFASLGRFFLVVSSAFTLWHFQSLKEPSHYEMMVGRTCPPASEAGKEQNRSHVRHRFLQQSDSRKHSISQPLGSHAKSAQYMGPIHESVAVPANLVKSPKNAKANPVDARCACSHESERWQQGQWSGEEWEAERCTTRKAGMCKCLAGAAADCTAVCCCPLSLLHLLALACIKLPSIIVIRTLRKVKTKIRKKRKCQEANENDIGPATPFTPSLSCRESMHEDPWTPPVGFADARMWQEYFGPDPATDYTPL